MFAVEENKKIGFALAGLGIGLHLFGAVTFLNRTLLVLGNLFFLMGLAFIIGVKKTILFFTKRDKWIGSLIFFAGFVLMVIRHQYIGYIVQLYGIWRLFSNFLPNLINSLRYSPVGKVFDLPIFQRVLKWGYDRRQLPI